MRTAAGMANVDPEEARKAAIKGIADKLAEELSAAKQPVPSRSVLWKRAEEHYKKHAVHGG